MGERVNGIHEVRGSIPLASTDVPNVPAANDSVRRGTPEADVGSRAS